MKSRAMAPTPKQFLESLKACMTANAPECGRCNPHPKGPAPDGAMVAGARRDRHLTLAAADMPAKRAAEIEGLPHA